MLLLYSETYEIERRLSAETEQEKLSGKTSHSDISGSSERAFAPC